ncbi:MAG: hypothetical protein J7555_10475, partial [Chloroflexi bacterium]|nr:hypothetical protein [Chloroflexota bacterium]
MGKQINECRPQTIGRCRTGFPARQRSGHQQSEEKKLCAFATWWFILFSPKSLKGTKINSNRAH